MSKKALLIKLKLQSYSDKLSDRRKFKEIVSALEKKTHKNSKPGIKLIKKYSDACVLGNYMRAINYVDNFKLTKKRIKYLGQQIKKCKKKELVIFVHINNKVTGNKHLNILVLNLHSKEVTRIDPSDSKLTNITNKKVKNELVPFFKTMGFNFVGYDKRSKVIKHGKLCRYATPAEYIYGSKLNHSILKKFIINYFT